MEKAYDGVFDPSAIELLYMDNMKGLTLLIVSIFNHEL